MSSSCEDWTGIAAYRSTGSAHIAAGMPCQDAFRWASGERDGAGYYIVAVADGHGSAPHDRSDKGAELAAKAACEEFRAFLASQQSASGRFGNASVKGFRSVFPMRLYRRWRESVQQHDCSAPQPTESGGDVLRRYGTTLLCALVMPDQILALQIGDGAMVLVPPDDEPEILFKNNPELIGNEVDSLGSADATLYMQTRALEIRAGTGLVLCTDGLSGAGNLCQIALMACQYLADMGGAQLQAILPDYVDRNARELGGDDATLLVCTAPTARKLMASCEHASDCNVAAHDTGSVREAPFHGSSCGSKQFAVEHDEQPLAVPEQPIARNSDMKDSPAVAAHVTLDPPQDAAAGPRPTEVFSNTPLSGGLGRNQSELE